MKRAIFSLLFGILFLNATLSQTGKIFCNPLNISYRFMVDKPSRREAADPTMVVFKGEYFLFVSKSGGYWYSPDLYQWTFVTNPDLPWEDYAPSAVNVGDSVLYWIASSSESNPIFKTNDPKKGRWSKVSTLPMVVWDPCLFLDDDKRMYLYWGCNNGKPLYCVELDLKSSLKPIGETVECFGGNFEEHGWEQGGENNDASGWAAAPFVEGSWMNKINGKYYLQYAAPGTQWRIYADGVYTSDHPKGPFKYEPYSPFAYKRGGFFGGAGHGSTFQDKYGNWWHIGTAAICDKHIFERRLALFPAGVDKDGELYCHTTWSDFPQQIPTKKLEGTAERLPQWMLLSYHKKLTSSTTLDGYPLENAADEEIKSYWSAKTGDKGEWLMMDLGMEYDINAIQINFSEHQTQTLGRADIYFQYTLESSSDGNKWKMISDKSKNKTDVPHDFISLEKSMKARYIRLTNIHVADGTFAVRDLRVFGKGNGAAPAKASFVKYDRNPYNQRRLWLVWNKVEDATGYIIRYGIAKDKLYNTIMVYNQNEISMNFMNKGVDYYFTIDAFNENGITTGDQILEMPKTGAYKP